MAGEADGLAAGGPDDAGPETAAGVGRRREFPPWPAVAVAAHAAAIATAMMLPPTRIHNCAVRKGLPLSEPAPCGQP